MASFKIGDKVVKSPYWKANQFDSWGRGEGIGEIVKSPHALDPGEVDVRWPAGRCFEHVVQLVHLEEKDLHMTEIQCISCHFMVRRLEFSSPDSPPTSAMWDGGVIFKEGAGYGSILDGDIYLIAVCDECLKKKGMKIGNYM